MNTYQHTPHSNSIVNAMKNKTTDAIRNTTTALISMLLMLTAMTVGAAEGDTNSLTHIDFAALSGDRVQLTLTLSGSASEPKSFTTNHPARIALDLPSTTAELTDRNIAVSTGTIESIRVAEAQGRTRVVLNLTQLTPFNTKIVDNKIILIVSGTTHEATSAVASDTTTSAQPAKEPIEIRSSKKQLRGVDFRRGEDGEGRVVVTLSDPSTAIDMHIEGGDVVVDFINSQAPEELSQRLDVIDFATPVKFIETTNRNGSAHMSISTTGDYDYSGYQTDNTYTVEFRPMSEEEVATRAEREFKGERLSLNFQNIEVRAVLQLIADFTGLNVVVSDSVGGNLTLRLQNVPWDQALDIILKSKGLGMRQTNNVVMVAPAAEIAAREKLELESQKQIKELAPLRTEFIQINYAKAADIADLMKSEDRNLLSERGSVSVDERTNILLVQETSEKLAEINEVVKKLDIPVRQVMIESRIVVANNDFTKAIGTRLGFGVHGRDAGTNNNFAATGSGAGTDSMLGTSWPTDGGALPVTVPSLVDRTVSAAPIGGAIGGIALALLGSDYMVDLEIQAMQAEGQGELLSNPRVVTSDQKEASIKQGVEIPYQEASSSGATTVTFKEAVLELTVTPQITPDDRVMMELMVSKDSPDFSRSILGVPPLDTREITTEVLVGNGETVVLGGVFEQDQTNNVSKVPFFGDLPIIGAAFRSTDKTNDKRELLIFITPKILKDGLRAN